MQNNANKKLQMLNIRTKIKIISHNKQNHITEKGNKSKQKGYIVVKH